MSIYTILRSGIYCMCVSMLVACTTTAPYTNEDTVPRAIAEQIQNIVSRFTPVIFPCPIRANTLCAYPIVIRMSDKKPNAHITQETIVLSRGLIDLNLNETEMAYIIGHEIAHAVLEHIAFPYAAFKMELDADCYAIKLMHAAGYNILKADKTLKIFIMSDAMIISSNSYRLQKLREVIIQVDAKGELASCL